MSDNIKPTKIDIQPYSVKEILKLNKNVQPFVNNLIEHYLSGSMVSLTEENKICLEEKSKELNMTPSEIINFILSRFEITPPEKVKKIKIEVSNDRISIKKGKNFVTDF